jgi:hypothetical protein
MTNRIRALLDNLNDRFGFSEGGVVGGNPHDLGSPITVINGDELRDDYKDKLLETHEQVRLQMELKKDSLYCNERSLVEQINERMERLWSVRRSIRAVEAGIDQMRRPFDKPKPLALLTPPDPRKEAAE